MVEIRNRKELVSGKLATVHPEVANGTVTAGIAKDKALAPGYDPQEQVDAVITVGNLTNVVQVGRPVLGRTDSRVMLFKLEADGRSAKKVRVQFGAASVNRIEIKSGLQPGDKVIVSDMSKYDRAAAITLQ